LGEPTSGQLITFEGIEGCGKSTQIELLSKALMQRGFSVLVTCEPGGTAPGRSLRQIVLGSREPLPPIAELMIYLADRACHLFQVVNPALAQGKIVLCDRFSDSTLAYQSFGRGLDLELVRSWDARITCGRRPDLTLLLDCPVSVGLGRVARRLELDRLDREDAEFHERVRAGFLDLARREQDRIKVVDTTRSVEEAHESILEIVLRKLEGVP